MCYNQIISERFGKWFMWEPVSSVLSGMITPLLILSLSGWTAIKLQLINVQAPVTQKYHGTHSSFWTFPRCLKGSRLFQWKFPVT